MKIDTIRHSAAHVLAYAVKKLYKNVKLGIGPAIENGFYYDFDNLKITEEDLEKIEKEMGKIIKEDLKFKKIKTDKKKAKELLKNEPYKLELLEDIKQPSFYELGDFIDLCAGPHVSSTGKLKAVKLDRLAGAYWKGDSKNKMLTRIYGLAFEDEKELKEFSRLKEEAEKRNHIKLGKELDLFSMHGEGPGFPFLHAKGMVIWDELMKYWNEEHKKEGYVQIRTPIILKRNLWESSGHWEHFKDNMYFIKIDNEDYAIKPMNCPGGMLVYKERIHSYKEFPLKVAEIGLVHRHELSGVLNGLFRVRSFFQDDAHIFCMEEQVEKEIIDLIKLIDRMYKTFNLKYHIELSTRPKKYIGNKKVWSIAERALENALKKLKIKYQLNKGDGAFYGPKIDFHVKDSLGRTWQCGTIQLDFAMPEKFKLTYEGKDGRKHQPVMLHRTVYGSLERFLGILIEHYEGKFPLWLAPIQVVILTVNDRNKKFADEIKQKLEDENIRVELNDKAETIPKKVNDAEKLKIPIILTIGDKEVKNKSLAVRMDNKVKFGVKVDESIKEIKNKIEKRC